MKMTCFSSQFSDIACETVKTVFKQDKSGEVTLEVNF